MKRSLSAWCSAYRPEGTLTMHIIIAGGRGVVIGACLRAILCRCVDEVGVEASHTLQDKLRGVSPAGCCTDPDDTLTSRGRRSGAENTASGFRPRPDRVQDQIQSLQALFKTQNLNKAITVFFHCLELIHAFIHT